MPGMRPVPTPHHGKKIARRLVMFFSSGRLKEKAFGNVVAHKKRIRPGEVAADNPISFTPPKPHEGLETRTEIIGSIPSAVWIVGNNERHRWTKRCVIFNRDHARLDRRNRFPNPVVVVVDVDTEKINLPRHATLFE